MIALLQHNAERHNHIAYHVAGQVLVSDTALAPLVAFPQRAQPAPASPRAPLQKIDCIYRAQSWVAYDWRMVTCWRCDAGYRVDVDAIATYDVYDSGIIVAHPLAAVDSRLVQETLFGPALLLALAARATLCLHVGAVAVDGEALLFLGESGRGKSTLAYELSRMPAFEHLADDALPVAYGDRLVAYPHYPQLKLPPEAQPALRLPPQLPVKAIYVLAEPADRLASEPLADSDRAIALVRHTIAARLFDAPLLARHLQFATAAARQLPMRRLHYPRNFAIVEEIAELILE